MIKTHIANRLFLLFFGTIMLTGCNQNDDTSSNDSGILENLQAQFNEGNFTHLDFRYTLNGTDSEILNEVILEMNIMDDDISGFRILEVLTVKENAPLDLPEAHPDRQRLKLTLDQDAFGEVSENGARDSSWAETIIMINNSTTNSEPYAFIFESVISSAPLVILDEKLTLNFKTL